MKKIYVLLAALIIGIVPYISHATVSVSPLTVSSPTEQIYFSATDGEYFYSWSDTDLYTNNSPCGVDPSQGPFSCAWNDPSTGNPVNTVYVLAFDNTFFSDPTEVCNGGGDQTPYADPPYNGYAGYEVCLSSSHLIGSYSIVYSSGSEVITSIAMQTIIDNATSTIATNLGFGLPDLLSFMKTQFLLIMGGGLGMLQGLMVYIVFLAIATGVIYFLYRAFTFFRH